MVKYVKATLPGTSVDPFLWEEMTLILADVLSPIDEFGN
jgi:hypothetical protein